MAIQHHYPFISQQDQLANLFLVISNSNSQIEYLIWAKVSYLSTSINDTNLISSFGI